MCPLIGFCQHLSFVNSAGLILSGLDTAAAATRPCMKGGLLMQLAYMACRHAAT